jgi:NurA-like 5'-3' nuclease
MQRGILIYLISFFVAITACTTTENLKNKPKKITSTPPVINKPECIFTTERKKPAWVNRHYYEDEQYRYAVGSAPSHSSIRMQIKAAELSAKEVLSEQKQIVINSNIHINNTSQKTAINDQTQTTTKTYFFNTEKVDVWKDGDNCLIYVLIKQTKE